MLVVGIGVSKYVDVGVRLNGSHKSTDVGVGVQGVCILEGVCEYTFWTCGIVYSTHCMHQCNVFKSIW